MSLFLRSKLLDIKTGGEPIAVLNTKEAKIFGVMAGDKIELYFSKTKKVVAIADLSDTKVKSGEVGLFKDVWTKKNIEAEDLVEVSIESRPESIQAINRKLLGNTLDEKQMDAVVKDIVSGRLGDVEITYFTAGTFVKKYTDDELYYLTKSIAENGEQINLPVKAVDKHSIGGLPGNRTTMLAVPIIASLGLYIPKSSSRAITSPAGTADTMEVLAPVSFDMAQVRKIVKKTHACLVWGGNLNLAPADDRIIRVLHPLSLESYDQMLVSIMAKKVAMGIDYLIVDMPVGPTTKVKKESDAKYIAEKFIMLGKRFGMKVKVQETHAFEPIGAGIGPALEARDVLRVLQQHKLRPRDLEDKGILMAGELLELAGYCKNGQGKKIAEKQIKSGEAWKKMNEIIVAQGGKKNLRADEVVLGALRYEYHAQKVGKIIEVNNRAINEICINLGAPEDKVGGIHLHAHRGDKVKLHDKLLTLYASSDERLKLGIAAIRKAEVFKIK